MTKPSVSFEPATLASAVSKANRVAPTKGAAFDKAAGIVIEIDPKGGERAVVVKATDLELTYLEVVNHLEIDGMSKKTVWRLPSKVFNGIVSNLPIASDTPVTLIDDDTYLTIKCGKKKAKILKIDAGAAYMKWAPFDESDLVLVEGFAKRVSQVTWACDPDAIPYTGIRIDGESLFATDKYQMASVPCEVPVAEPITVPLAPIAPVMKTLTDARLAATERRLLLMPDEHTQITSTIYDAQYPPIDRVLAIEFPNRLTVAREEFKAALSAMMVLCTGERYPRVQLTIGNERIKMFMDVPKVGLMEDEIGVNGAAHDDYDISYTPTYITESLGAVDAPEIEWSYVAGQMNLVRISDQKDYRAWFPPRKD